MNLNGKIKKKQALTGRLVKSSGGGGSVQEIYWVQFGVGTATNAEVNEAVAANKLPICYWDSTDAYGRPRRTLYFLVRHTPTEVFFATVLPTTQTIEVKRLYADAFYTQIIRYEGKLTWDTTPRLGSVNPVTSGGIYQAIQNATVSDERIAKAVDDWLSVQAPSIGTLSYAAKQALLACFRHVAWIDDQGQSYYNALESELFPDATLESITAVFTQGSAVIYDTDSLDTLRQYLTVTATYSDSTTAVVSDYTLSGTLTAGTSTITASYGGKTDTFNVTVSLGLDSIAYGNLTYRELFINQNLLNDFGNMENNFVISSDWTYYYRSGSETPKSGYRIAPVSASQPSISTSICNSPTHSMDVTCANQTCYLTGFYNFPSAITQSYIVGAAINITAITAGKVEFQAFGTSSNIVRANKSAVTDGWEAVALIGSIPTAAQNNTNLININFGALKLDGASPSLTGYIDDLVLIPLPSGMTQEQAQTAFSNYIRMVRSGE